MKKSIKYFLLVIVIAVLVQIPSKAQMFEKDDAVLNLGIGLGHAYGLYAGASVWPGLNASFEYGVYKLKKIGVFSVGGILAWQHAGYEYIGDDISWNELYFGLRSQFHLTMLEVDNLDVYGGITLGLRTYSDPDITNNGRYENHYYVNPFGGLFVGGRWYFSPGFGVFSELGYDVSWFKAGFSFRF
jgi:hypothetical protein